MNSRAARKAWRKGQLTVGLVGRRFGGLGSGVQKEELASSVRNLPVSTPQRRLSVAAVTDVAAVDDTRHQKATKRISSAGVEALRAEAACWISGTIHAAEAHVFLLEHLPMQRSAPRSTKIDSKCWKTNQGICFTICQSNRLFELRSEDKHSSVNEIGIQINDFKLSRNSHSCRYLLLHSFANYQSK